MLFIFCICQQSNLGEADWIISVVCRMPVRMPTNKIRHATGQNLPVKLLQCLPSLYVTRCREVLLLNSDNQLFYPISFTRAYFVLKNSNMQLLIFRKKYVTNATSHISLIILPISVRIFMTLLYLIGFFLCESSAML